MKKLSLFVLALLVLGGLIAAYERNTTAAPPSGNGGPVDCQIPHFEAFVRQGPNAGVALVGSMRIQADAHGSAQATLNQVSGPQITAVGQVEGRGIHLAFDLGGGKTVYGVGTLQYDIHECRGNLGGPFTGPDGGDSGDWLACFFCPTPTPGPAQPPIIRNPVWNSGKIYMDAGGSYIQTGATLQVSRSGFPTQSWTMSFDDSGTRFVAGGAQTSTPGGYQLNVFIPAGTPVTLVVRNPNGMQSSPVGFSR